jgi:hypothetical protein
MQSCIALRAEVPKKPTPSVTAHPMEMQEWNPCRTNGTNGTNSSEAKAKQSKACYINTYY